jgi:hypothetical protein
MTMSRMKFEGRDSAGEFAAASVVDEFAALIPFVFYMEEWIRGGWALRGGETGVSPVQPGGDAQLSTADEQSA